MKWGELTAENKYRLFTQPAVLTRYTQNFAAKRIRNG
jgi:hypothetical protein